PRSVFPWCLRSVSSIDTPPMGRREGTLPVSAPGASIPRDGPGVSAGRTAVPCPGSSGRRPKAGSRGAAATRGGCAVDKGNGVRYDDPNCWFTRVTTQRRTFLIQSGGGTGPMKPGNRRSLSRPRRGANSCRTQVLKDEGGSDKLCAAVWLLPVEGAFL